MARKKALRLLCGRRVDTEKAKEVRDNLIYSDSANRLAQRAADRMMVSQRIAAVARLDAVAPQFIGSLISLNKETGEVQEIDSVSLQHATSAVGVFYDEVAKVLSDRIGLRLEVVDSESSSTIEWHDTIGESKVVTDGVGYAFEHPFRDDVIKVAQAKLSEMHLPDVDALRSRFGFNYPMVTGERPVDPEGKQMGKRVMGAIEDYMGADREDVLIDLADIMGMQGISTNEARFFFFLLEREEPNDTYAPVRRIKRFDKIDELSDEGIVCIGKISDVGVSDVEFESKGESLGIYEDEPSALEVYGGLEDSDNNSNTSSVDDVEMGA